nr:uncharacterized protein LOC127315292 [Lolium perenne]
MSSKMLHCDDEPCTTLLRRLEQKKVARDSTTSTATEACSRPTRSPPASAACLRERLAGLEASDATLASPGRRSTSDTPFTAGAAPSLRALPKLGPVCTPFLAAGVAPFVSKLEPVGISAAGLSELPTYATTAGGGTPATSACRHRRGRLAYPLDVVVNGRSGSPTCRHH